MFSVFHGPKLRLDVSPTNRITIAWRCGEDSRDGEILAGELLFHVFFSLRGAVVLNKKTLKIVVCLFLQKYFL